jgi:predicted nucleic acid-binding protein
MGVFIDTSVFIALHNADDRYHQKSKELIKNALKGNLGRIYTSDYIIDEAVTTALVRTRKHDIAVDLGTYIIGSPRIIKLTVDQDTFKAAWTKFKTLEDKALSFTDCTSIALTEKHGINHIMSFDRGFDGLIQRIS